MFLHSLLAVGDLMKEVSNYFFNFSSTVNSARTVMLWAAIALVCAFVAATLALPKEKQPLVRRIFLFLAVGFAAVNIVLFSTLNFLEDEMTAMTFYPLLVCVLCVVGGMIALLLKPTKLVKIISFSGMGASFLTVLVCMTIYQVSGEAAEIGGVADNETGLYISALLLTAAIVAIGFFCDRDKSPFDARTIAFAGMSVTLSFALSYIRLFKMPMGGSITFASALPVMLFSFMFGTRKGLLVGLVFGVLQALQDPWIIHPAQFLLDYPVAFSAAGLAGLFRNVKPFEKTPRIKFAFGAIATGIFRFISHVLSGALAFEAYAEGQNAWLYSLGYNVYVFIDVALVIVAAILLLSSPAFRKQIETK